MNRAHRHAKWRQHSSLYMVGPTQSSLLNCQKLTPSIDLSPEARILYSSDSIVDVLGWSPEDVVNRSCWDFFHPAEIPIAREKHGKGIALDKAAMLNYCSMRDKDENYVGCEVVFTVVYDVLVGCTSIYRRGLRSASESKPTQCGMNRHS